MAATTVSLTSRSARETRRLGEDLGRLAQPGDVFLLIGNLGAGKTLLAQAIARGLEVPDAVISPTFVLVREHQGRLPFYHVDLYRLECLAEGEALGLENYLYGPGVCAVEWADRAQDYLPQDNLTIRIEYVSQRSRKMDLEAHGTRYEELLAGLRAAGWGA